jgi:serine/threonine-protein kinase
VPDVVGQQRADAQAALRSAGLVTEVKAVPSAKPEGTVVSQAPKAGASLARGEHVLINVASGTKPGEGAGAPTTVPDVVGKMRAEAQQAIRQAGLVTEVKGVSSNEAEGTVVAQDPKAGVSAKRGAHVLINVANGQQPQ